MPGARHFTELIVWKLGDQLRAEVFKITRRSRLRSDFKLRSQLDDAADSACRNIAEGFGCGTHREFARFVRISRRSLNEVQDCFRSALLKGYVSDSDLAAARSLLRRIFPALSSLLRHLDGPDRR
jgi:four helix bundle protein